MKRQYLHSLVPTHFPKFLLCLTALFLLPLQDVTAQDASVQGTITTRQTGEPLYGVSVGIEGRTDAVEVVGQRQRVASATKTLTQLRDLPVAIQIVSQETLQEQAVVDLKGALRNVTHRVVQRRLRSPSASRAA